jgi:hypothetical protein
VAKIAKNGRGTFHGEETMGKYTLGLTYTQVTSCIYLLRDDDKSSEVHDGGQDVLDKTFSNANVYPVNITAQRRFV